MPPVGLAFFRQGTYHSGLHTAFLSILSDLVVILIYGSKEPLLIMFSYSRLKRETSDIRLVRFQQPAPVDPGAAPIELEFRHASFDDDIHFAALSYVWGRSDTNTAALIYIHGGSFTIGSNLHAALTQLYQSGVRAWLWVDSICINQSDMEEKSLQVAQMRTIFSRANHVYIWLGPGSIETAKAMDFATRVGTRALAVGVLDLWLDSQLRKQVTQNINDWASSVEVRDRNDGSSVMARELTDFIFDILREPSLHERATLEERILKNAPTNLKEDSLVRGIRELMEREYWHRIWIVQEISLAQEATVLCGEKAIPLDILDATFSAVSHCITSGFRRLHHETQDFAYGLSANFYESIALTTRRKHRRQDQSGIIRLADIVYQAGVPPGRPHYSATDPRDISFGLLGVITDGGALGLRVDYTMKLAEVFTALTRSLIYDGDENRPAYHLDQCVPKQRWDSPDSLPSWVPDWEAIGKHGPEVYPINYSRAFNATAGIPTPPRPRNCNEDDARGILRCPGCCVDVVTDVMHPPQWKKRDDWTASKIVDVEAWLSSICDFAKLGPESSPGEDYVWRTIMLDMYDGISRPNRFEAKPIDDEKASVIRKIMRRVPIVVESLTEAQRHYIWYELSSLSNFETIDQKLEYIVEWLKVIGSVDRGRTLFKTNKGMFGLGHVAIQREDIVCLLWGTRSPIILRPRNDEAGGGFIFVGDAYIDGIMYGEFLQTVPAHRDFEIY